MLTLELPGGRTPLRVLCIGAHCDDIDIGCGGAMLAMLSSGRKVDVTWVAFSSSPERAAELCRSAKRFLRGARNARVISHGFQDGFFPAHFRGIKETFEKLKPVQPDIVFTHHRADRHQDHRLLADLTWNTFRNNLVLEYEIPKYEGDLTTPSAYVALKPVQVERKIRILLESYRSQHSKPWFTADTFRALMRLRGIESGAATGWAEGFHVSKFVVGS